MNVLGIHTVLKYWPSHARASYLDPYFEEVSGEVDLSRARVYDCTDITLDDLAALIAAVPRRGALVLASGSDRNGAVVHSKQICMQRRAEVVRIAEEEYEPDWLIPPPPPRHVTTFCDELGEPKATIIGVQPPEALKALALQQASLPMPSGEGMQLSYQRGMVFVGKFRVLLDTFADNGTYIVTQDEKAVVVKRRQTLLPGRGRVR